MKNEKNNQVIEVRVSFDPETALLFKRFVRALERQNHTSSSGFSSSDRYERCPNCGEVLQAFANLDVPVVLHSANFLLLFMVVVKIHNWNTVWNPQKWVGNFFYFK